MNTSKAIKMRESILKAESFKMSIGEWLNVQIQTDMELRTLNEYIWQYLKWGSPIVKIEGTKLTISNTNDPEIRQKEKEINARMIDLLNQHGFSIEEANSLLGLELK